MKVLQVVVGGRWSGVCIIVRDFVRALRERGDEVWTVCVHEEVARRFEEAGAHTVLIKGWKKGISLTDVWPTLQIAWLCLRRRCRRRASW